MDSNPKLISVRGTKPLIAVGVGGAIGAALQDAWGICAVTLLVTLGYVAAVGWVAAIRWRYWAELMVWCMETGGDESRKAQANRLAEIDPPRSLECEHAALVAAFGGIHDGPEAVLSTEAQEAEAQRLRDAWNQLTDRMVGRHPSPEEWADAPSLHRASLTADP